MNFLRNGRRGLALALLAALPFAASIPPARAAVTDSVFNPTTGHWYKYIPGAVTWAQAKAGAVAINGDLCSYSDLAEIQWTLTNLGVQTGSVWIGGSDNGSEGTWYWSNGDPWTFTNWNAGEPNNSGTEDYLMMYTNPTSVTNYGRWNDAPTSYTMVSGYIVEWSTNPNPPPPPVFPTAPTNLTASLSAQGVVQLAWTDTSLVETNFELQRKAGDGSFSGLASLAADTTTHDDTDLVPLTGYTYRVRAVNQVGPSGWSNEATVVSGTYAPVTPAPSNLIVVDVTAGTADLQWTDKSNGETAFELHRAKGGAALSFLALTSPDVTTYHDSGLSPDAGYRYAVRSIGTYRVSSFTEATTVTDPTLTVAATKGDLKDSTKFGKDSLKVSAGWSFLDGVSDGAMNPVTEGLTLRAGGAGAPLVLSLQPNEPGWKGKGAKWKWKSPAGGATKYQVQVDLDKRLVTVAVTGLELAAAPANPVTFSLAVGNDAGTESAAWEVMAKPGYLRLR